MTLTAQPTADELRAQMVAAARSLVGARYAHRGRERETGFDCLGLVLASARLCGFETFDYFYDLIPAEDLLDAKLAEHAVKLADWRLSLPGDIVTRCYRIGEPAKHCGVVTLNVPDNLRCVHASRVGSHRGVFEMRWTDAQYNVSAFRLREIAAAEASEKEVQS
jgi:cell wall-associated NlpC family hydrolase